MQYRLLLYLFDDCMNSMDPAKKGPLYRDADADSMTFSAALVGSKW